MPRFSILLSVVVVVLLGSAVVLSRPSALAQEATPTGMATRATHPVVGTWDRIAATLRECVCLQLGRESTPSAAIIDSQSGKTTENEGSAGPTGVH